MSDNSEPRSIILSRNMVRGDGIEPNPSYMRPKRHSASIELILPNNTFITVRGDIEIVQQVVDMLDGMKINYHKQGRYE